MAAPALEGTQIFVLLKIMAASQGMKKNLNTLKHPITCFCFEVGSCTYVQILLFAGIPSFQL